MTAGFARVTQMMQQKHKTLVSERTARLLAAVAEGSSAEDFIAPLTQNRAANPGARQRRLTSRLTRQAHHRRLERRHQADMGQCLSRRSVRFTPAWKSSRWRSTCQ